MKSYAFDVKNSAIFLRKEGKTTIEISNALNIPSRTVYKWIKEVNLTEEERREITYKCRTNAVKKAAEVNTKKYEKNIARQLRIEGKSIKQIAKIVGVSQSSVSVWVRDINLTEEQKEELKRKRSYNIKKVGEIHSKKYLELRKSYQLKGKNKVKECNKKYIAGIMLYWAEGLKGRNVVQFSNSDVGMMKYFVDFLCEECGVLKEEMKIHIHCYINNGKSKEEIEKYWLEELMLQNNSLGKTIIEYPKEDRGKKQGKLVYGTCNLNVCKTSLVQEFYGAIQEFAGVNHNEWIK